MTAPYVSPYSKRRAGTTSGDYANAAGNMAGNDQAAGQTANDAFLTGATNFDAQSGLNKYAQGAWGSISDALNQSLKNLQGADVGAGRLNTGYYTEDTGNIYRTATKQLADAIASGSLTAQGQQLENQGQLAGYAGSTLDRAGQENAAMLDYQNALAAARKKKRGGIGAAIGGVLGAVGGSFFPVVGSTLGGELGAALGGAVGGG